MSIMMHEATDEELGEYQRLDELYAKLSETERHYIVSRWDDEQGLIPTYQRENYRNSAAFRAR